MSHFNSYLFIAVNIVTAFMGEKAFAANEKTSAASHKPKPSKDKYLQGYYYDGQGHKVEGLIAKEDLNFQSFLFKKQLGDTAQKIPADACDSFVVGSHVFHSIADVSIKAVVWSAHFDRAFAELVKDGPVQLYRISFEPGKVGYMHYVAIASNFTGGIAGQAVGMMASKQRASYFVRRGTGNAYLRVEKGTFADQMSAYLKDDPAVVAKIQQNQDYSFNNIELIIAEYDQDKR